MKRLTEDNRQQLISRSKSSDNYAKNNQHKGKNRFQRRVHSKIDRSVKEFNSINMNKLFQDDILDVNIRVHGETKDYVVTIKMSGVLENMRKEFNDSDAIINYTMIKKALVKSFNNEDIYVHCTCPDFKYRHGYYALMHSISSWDDVFNKAGRIVRGSRGQVDDQKVRTQKPRVAWTNPKDSKGPACKHVMLVLSNNTWLLKVSSVISNYINWMKKHQEELYREEIYPAIFKTDWTPDSQYGKEAEFDYKNKDKKLPSNRRTLDTTNKWALEKDRFKKGNQSGIQFASNKKPDIDNLIDDTEAENNK